MDPATIVGIALIGLACFALGILWAGDHFREGRDQILEHRAIEREKAETAALRRLGESGLISPPPSTVRARRDVYDQYREER